MTSRDSTSSEGRSGLVNRWPRLREYISSKNTTETPSWARNSTSQSRIAAMNRPAAWATQALCAAMNWLMRPQRIICTVGQYASSSTRGHEPLSR